MIEMRARSQFTLPSKLVKKMGIREGDKFEVVEQGEGIYTTP